MYPYICNSTAKPYPTVGGGEVIAYIEPSPDWVVKYVAISSTKGYEGNVPRIGTGSIQPSTTTGGGDG